MRFDVGYATDSAAALAPDRVDAKVACDREDPCRGAAILYAEEIRFSPDGNQVLTGSKDNTARLWDTATGKEVLGDGLNSDH